MLFFAKIVTAEANCEVDWSGTFSAELGGYAALYSIDGSTTFDLGVATLEISGAMYFGSVSGGAEFDINELSGSYTSVSLGTGYKIGWDVDWK